MKTLTTVITIISIVLGIAIAILMVNELFIKEKEDTPISSSVYYPGINTRAEIVLTGSGTLENKQIVMRSLISQISRMKDTGIQKSNFMNAVKPKFVKEQNLINTHSPAYTDMKSKRLIYKYSPVN